MGVNNFERWLFRLSFLPTLTQESLLDERGFFVQPTKAPVHGQTFSYHPRKSSYRVFYVIISRAYEMHVNGKSHWHCPGRQQRIQIGDRTDKWKREARGPPLVDWVLFSLVPDGTLTFLKRNVESLSTMMLMLLQFLWSGGIGSRT